MQTNQEPLSLAKAKKEKLRMAKFPLDKYLQWGAGSGKTLTLNQCTSILLDVKKTGDWKYALRHVPKRKIIDFEQLPTNPDLRYDKRLRKFRTAWKPSLSRLSFNREKLAISLLHDDDDEEDRKPRVNLKNIIK